MIIINDLPYGLKRMPVTVQPHDRDTNIYVLLYSHNNKSGSMRTQNSYHEEYRTTIINNIIFNIFFFSQLAHKSRKLAKISILNNSTAKKKTFSSNCVHLI